MPLSLWMQCWSPRRRFPCSLREWLKNFTFFGISSFYFSSIRSDGHKECSDYNLANVFSTKGRKCFPEFKKKQKKTKNIKKTDQHKVPIVSVNAVLTTPPKFSLQSPRTIKNLYFFRNIHFLFFLITFLWTRRMRWLQPRWRVVDKRPQMFRSKCKNGKKYIIQKNDLHKGPIVSLNAVLIIPPKISLQSPRMAQKFYVFRKIKILFFLNTFRWTQRMQWLQPRRGVFDERQKMFPWI